jgi:hypothetical protein
VITAPKYTLIHDTWQDAENKDALECQSLSPRFYALASLITYYSYSTYLIYYTFSISGHLNAFLFHSQALVPSFHFSLYFIMYIPIFCHCSLFLHPTITYFCTYSNHLVQSHILPHMFLHTSIYGSSLPLCYNTSFTYSFPDLIIILSILSNILHVWLFQFLLDSDHSAVLPLSQCVP